jgi:hypothetical protein
MTTITRLAAPASLVALLLAAGGWSGVALAHCGSSDSRCSFDPCHAGPGTASCKEAAAGARAIARIPSPETGQVLQELILPRVPQWNLPEVGKAVRRVARRPANLPAPPGLQEQRLPASIDPRPLPSGLPPASVARELAPQVFSGAMALTRELDHQRAIEELRRTEPQLAESAWLRERMQRKAGEAFRQLQRVDQRSQAVLKMLPEEPGYAELRDSLARTTRALQSIGAE